MRKTLEEQIFDKLAEQGREVGRDVIADEVKSSKKSAKDGGYTRIRVIITTREHWDMTSFVGSRRVADEEAIFTICKPGRVWQIESFDGLRELSA